MELFENPRRGRLGNLATLALERRQRFLLDLEVEARRELDRPQNPDRILGEANGRIADGAYEPAAQVAEAVGVIQHVLVVEVVEQRVDREVAAQGVFLGGAE